SALSGVQVPAPAPIFVFAARRAGPLSARRADPAARERGACRRATESRPALMTSLAARVLAGIRRRQLFEPGARVVAAVSGGSDSVALAWLLRELSDAGALRLTAIAHLDHSLRGAESARDAAFCRDLAAELGVPFDVEAADVARLAKEHGQSIEEAGREARSPFFEPVRARASADAVATGHTRDDQAE